jgi:hypothetical protein
MSLSRHGKIARLPRDIRAQLNRWLQNGEPGNQLVKWLNALPEVQAVLAAGFDGQPINEQNLSAWKQGGYREWLAQQEMLAQARELAANATELMEAADGRLADHLATVLAARYAALLAGWDGEVTEEFRRQLRVLHSLGQDFVELRRGDHSGARLDLERERLEREREKTEEEVLEHFKRWSRKPGVQDCICGNYLSPEERETRLRQQFGLEPKPAADAASPGDAAPNGHTSPTPPDQPQSR